MKRVIALLVVALMSVAMLNAKNVSGYVSDKNGNPVVGLKMVVVNADCPADEKLVVATDVEGYFSLSVPETMDVDNLTEVFSQRSLRVVKFWKTPCGSLRIVVDTERK